MGIDVESARLHVIAMYPKAKEWRTRVLRMSDDQVLAIYRRKVVQDAQPKPKPEPVIEEPPDDLTLF